MITERSDDLRERLLKSEEVRTLISNRAYELYERRGCQPGKEVEDWVRAESEILRLAPLIEKAVAAKR